ncbi:DNA helicase [Beauveria brongniartii RCEF 3172]|uniref:DNA helicase n=1 Tax=Beauveria brongniartii RCEF 3172 TaxID=1081107 RepID=A0A162J5L9_9HYPO|nr:DNA helicase [Beauveria brongniartii RCEF 3172]
MQTNLPFRPAKRQGNNTAVPAKTTAPAKPATAAKPAQAETRTMSQKPRSSEKPDKAPKIQAVFGKDCAILLGESLTPVVVAKALDKNSMISAKLRILRPQDCDPFIGYTIEVDLVKDQAPNETLGFGVRYDCRRVECDAEVATKHVINVKFPRDVVTVVENARQALPNYSEIFSGSKYSEAAVVHITIPENSEPTIEGFGLPFSDRENKQLEGWLNDNKPIAAGFSLVDIIRQKKMSFFLDLSVQEVNKKYFAQPLPEPFILPYQTVSVKLEDYREPVRMHRGHQFTPNFVLDSDSQHNIVVNHAVVQDMLWIYEAALEIKEIRRPLYFALLDETSVSVDDKGKFYVLMTLTDDFMAVYGDAWRRLASSDKVELSFYNSETGSGPCEEWDGTIIKHPETIPRFVECHAPNAEKELVMLIEPSKRPCKHPNWATIYIDPGVEDARRKMMATDQFLDRSRPANVAGWNLANPDEKPTAEQLQSQAQLKDMMQLHRVFVRAAGFWEWQMKGNNVPRSLPVFNFLEIRNEALVTAIVQEALPEDQDRWAHYLQHRPLGFGAMAAGPGTGKTTMMAAAVLAMAARVGKVLCSAPTHVATTNFAERIYKRSCAVVERYRASTAKSRDAPRYHRLTVVRGHKMEFELTAIKALLVDPSLGDAAVPVRMFQGNSRWKLHLSPAYWFLMVLGSTAVRKLEQDDSARLWHLHNVACEPAMARLRDLARGKMTWAQYREKGTADDSQLSAYVATLLKSADVLCVTPAASHNVKQYKMWKHWQARAIAIDEAGNMNCADLYNVWGNTMQPCFLGGDPKQLPPAVMSSMDKDADGNYRNRFAKYGRVSALLKFQAMGMPMYRLNQQLRMAKGMFDMPSAIIYPDVSFTYSPSCNILRPEFKIGRDLESYLRKAFPKLAAPPADKVRPVFLHCPKSTTVVDPATSSKLNSDQVTVALDTVAGFVKAMKVDPARIGILSPYGANVAEIKEQLKRRQYEQIRGMPSPSTVDSFQGQENDIIVMVMGTTVASGPGFTVDPARLNVAMTRPRSGLIIVGDINAAGPLMDSNGKLTISKDAAKQTFEYVDAEGNVCVRKAPALRSILTTLAKDGRVVTVS